MAEFEQLELSEKDATMVNRYKYGESFVRGLKARTWTDRYLIKVGGESHQPWNCCEKGWIALARKDGQPLTDDDIAAVKAVSLGQENSFVVSDDRMKIKHIYLCDSSD